VNISQNFIAVQNFWTESALLLTPENYEEWTQRIAGRQIQLQTRISEPQHQILRTTQQCRSSSVVHVFRKMQLTYFNVINITNVLTATV
jgi:hypothetical protein